MLEHYGEWENVITCFYIVKGCALNQAWPDDDDDNNNKKKTRDGKVFHVHVQLIFKNTILRYFNLYMYLQICVM